MHADPALQQAHACRLFKRRRKPLTVKWRAVRCWLAGCSLRRTTMVLDDEAEFSHEAVRQWAGRFAHLFRPRKKTHRRIVVDETTIHLSNGREVYEWAALDADSRDVLLVWKTQGRGGLEALLFMKALLRRCRGKPFVMVDKGPWYPWALQTLRLDWKVQRGGPRSLVESYFGSLKHRLTRMRRRPQSWHTEPSLIGILNLHAYFWNRAH